MGKRRRHPSSGPSVDDTIFEISEDNRGEFDFPSPDSPGDRPSSSQKHPHRKRAKKKEKRNVGSEPGVREALGLRIIGGKFRGSKLEYIGDNRVRPMKDRVREALFNLIGPGIRGMHVVDLFGGTGAVAIEALSRGAVSATIIELHLPTAALLRKNLESLDLLKICNLRKIDAFFWAKNEEEHPKEKTPWIVFCCPPYDFYVQRQSEMLEMFDNLVKAAPEGSVFVIESDERFNFDLLPISPHPNKVRSYPPAEIAVCYKENGG